MKKALVILLLSTVLFAGMARAASNGGATVSGAGELEDPDDREGYPRAWPRYNPQKQLALLSSCKSMAAALGLDIKGSTLFCPVNWAWGDVARQLALYGADPVAELLAGVPAETLRKVFLNHVIPRTILPTAAFKTGRTNLTTAAGGTLTVRKLSSSVDVMYRSHLHLQGDYEDMTLAEGMTAASLTFYGPFQEGSSGSGYVIHPVEYVLIPDSAVGELMAIKNKNDPAKDFKLPRRLLP